MSIIRQGKRSNKEGERNVQQETFKKVYQRDTLSQLDYGFSNINSRASSFQIL